MLLRMHARTENGKGAPNREFDHKEKYVAYPCLLENHMSQQLSISLHTTEMFSEILFRSLSAFNVSICIYLKFNSSLSVHKTKPENLSIEVL